ncbi:MAG TPA: DUF1565 domain-containing protein, partial [Pedobacter sp.]|uniref:DUF1565 domain-containing protein n=1 Tax=Pedobacter sp. TaxID=1411316 RepID=UPI002C418717
MISVSLNYPDQDNQDFIFRGSTLQMFRKEKKDNSATDGKLIPFMISSSARTDFPAFLSRLVLYTLIGFNLPATAQHRPAKIYVAQLDPKASDADNAQGTAEHPFKTIARAFRTVKPGDRVVIRKGIYRESADL